MLVQEHGRLAAWVGMVGLLAAATLRSASAQSAPPGAGECGTCHYDLALAYTFPAGHAAALDCIACHGDRRPGRVGRRHRTIPNCATCHDDVHGHPTKAAERLGRRQTRNCLNCHDPFAPVATEDNCVLCHQDEAARHTMPSGHAVQTCTTCHAERDPTPGPDHRAIEGCQTCHPSTQTHAPAGVALPCLQCHDPHGSQNIKLVRETITTP